MNLVGDHLFFNQGEQSNVENEVQDISFELQFNKH